MVEIEYCYNGGSLTEALKQAAEFVQRISATNGQEKIVAVLSQPDDMVGWTVLVVWHNDKRS